MANTKVPKPIRGTQSLLGEDADRFHAVVSAFDHVRHLFGFQRVELPVLERTEVFARSLGETSDVVSKEMYTFFDRSERSVTLRPEFTAGIARAYLSEGWQRFSPLRVATDGPVFRYEAPQSGRYRQFHQLDAEIIGIADPRADIETLVLADHLLKVLDIETEVSLKLNTLGDTESREAWRASLLTYFTKHQSELSEESVDRLQRNPLRILDSKDARDKMVAANAPKMMLTSAAEEFFKTVQIGLAEADIDYDLDTHLVRGLDYYRHTTFEFVAEGLGSQNAVLAGGRYDGLIEALGGPSTPAVGWAAGIERLAKLLPTETKPTRTAAIVVESDEAALVNIGKFMLGALRQGGMPAQMVADGSVRKRFQRATALQSDYLLILNPSPYEGDYGILRVKRRIIDRYRTRGTIFKALRNSLENQFGVPVSEFRKVVRRGGDVRLMRKNQA